MESYGQLLKWLRTVVVFVFQAVRWKPNGNPGKGFDYVYVNIYEYIYITIYVIMCVYICIERETEIKTINS